MSPCEPTPVGETARKLRPSSAERRTKAVRPRAAEESHIAPSPPSARVGWTDVPAGSTGAAGLNASPPVGRKGGAAPTAPPTATTRNAATATAARSDPIRAES